MFSTFTRVEPFDCWLVNIHSWLLHTLLSRGFRFVLCTALHCNLHEQLVAVCVVGRVCVMISQAQTTLVSICCRSITILQQSTTNRTSGVWASLLNIVDYCRISLSSQS